MSRLVKLVLFASLLFAILTRMPFAELYGKGTGKNLESLSPVNVGAYALVSGLRERGFSLVQPKKALYFVAIPGEVRNVAREWYLQRKYQKIKDPWRAAWGEIDNNAKKFAQELEKDATMRTLMTKTSSPVLSLSAGVCLMAALTLPLLPRESLLALMFGSVIFFVSLNSSHNARPGEGLYAVSVLGSVLFLLYYR